MTEGTNHYVKGTYSMGTSRIEQKCLRLLRLNALLQDGLIVRKAEAAVKFGVTERSIQRDIQDLRDFFADQIPPREITYDAKAKGYRLTERNMSFLSNSEILAVCKILLESRSMMRAEMLPILDRLISCCVPEQNKKAVTALVSNEKHHYIEPRHGKSVLNALWEIGQAIQNHKMIEIEYERLKTPNIVKRVVNPVGIMFSEYYFYLTAFLQNVDRETEFENKNDLSPTIYRIDRIQSVKILPRTFYVPYKDRFEEGEFRKRVQFMYGGKLQRIRFRYTGLSLEAVLDRLPTAEIVSQNESGWEISAEVFGSGIDMWLRSQGDYIERL